MKTLHSCAAVALLLCAAARPAAGATLGLQVSQLLAQATSIILPSTPGTPCNTATTIPCPPTGDISISGMPGPSGTIDQATGEGRIYFPAQVNFPLLGALGLGPLNVTQAGTYFISQPDNALFSVDIGRGEVQGKKIVIINTNEVSNAGPLLSDGAGSGINGTFEDITRAQYDTLLAGRIRGMLDAAVLALHEIDPLAPNIGAAVLDAVAAMYDSNPATELILYFPDAAPGDQFRTSQLTGTARLELAAIPEPASLALMAVGLLAMARRRRASRRLR